MKKYYLFLLSCLFSTICFATNIIVTNTNDAGEGSLRAAIETAISGDTVRFSPAIIADGSATLTLASQISFSKAITIVGVYNETDSLFISGGGAHRIFRINDTGSVKLDSLILQDGRTFDGEDRNGACVAIFDSYKLHVNHSVIRNNIVYGEGAGLYARNEDNTGANIVVKNSILDNNNRVDGSATFGGAVVAISESASSEIEIDNCVITNSNGGHGGVNAHSYFGGAPKVIVTNSTLANNFQAAGADMFYAFGSSNISSVIMDNCEVYGNTRGLSSDTYANINFQITNSVFSDNEWHCYTQTNDENTVITISGSQFHQGGPVIEGDNGDFTINITDCIFNETTRGVKLTDGEDILLNIDETSITGCVERPIYGEGSAHHVTIKNSEIKDNVVSSSAAAISFYGAGSTEVNLQIDSCLFQNNVADTNGGVINVAYGNNSSIQISNSTLQNNTAGQKGGLIYLDVEGANTAPVRIENSTIYNNQATEGAVIFVENESDPLAIEFVNSTIYNNSATEDGALVFTNGSDDPVTVSVINSTLLDNHAAATNYQFHLLNGELETLSSVISHTEDNTLFYSYDESPINSLGYNVFSATTLEGTVESDQLAIGTDLLNFSPITLNDNGTLSFIPLYPSVCINKGNPDDASLAQNGILNQRRDVGAAESCVTSEVDHIVSCEEIEWMDGNTYTEDNQTASYPIQGEGECVHIIELDFDLALDDTVEEVVACESFTWIDGMTYTENTNTPNVTLTNVHGCDSVVTLHLNIIQPTESVDVVSTCDSFEWIDGVTYTESNATATYVTTNSVGCDSTIYLDLSISHSTEGTAVVESCESFEWIDGNVYTESNNTATFVLTNAAGCDSVVSLDLTIPYLNPILSLDGTVLSVNEMGDSYQWLDCTNDYAEIPGATEATYTATENGDYALTITVGSCSFTSDCEAVRGIGIVEDEARAIAVYPNPVIEQLHVQMPSNDTFEVRIVDVAGREVFAEKQWTNDQTIKVAQLEAGIYILYLKNEAQEMVQRFEKVD